MNLSRFRFAWKREFLIFIASYLSDWPIVAISLQNGVRAYEYNKNQQHTFSCGSVQTIYYFTRQARSVDTLNLLFQKIFSGANRSCSQNNNILKLIVILK
jgi:hypothetical protein